MLIAFLILLLLLLALHAYREFWRLRLLPQIYRGEFTGELMKVGETYIARRSARNGSQRTIIGFPGFLHDMRYFQDLYKDHDAELILVNNAGYHCPFPVEEVTELEWPENPYKMGTIEHDGFYLGLVVERLASGREVCLHGHSRGGAVVLDAGRQYPQLMNSKECPVSAVLEAPILPQARAGGAGGKASKPLQHRINCYLLPIFFGWKRDITAEQLLKLPMMRPTNPLKTHLCLAVFSVARRYATCVTNVKSIFIWQCTNKFDLYENYPSLTVLIGERDDSLDRPSMLASAEQGRARNSGLSIVKTVGTNHFISLEQPEVIRSIH